MTKEAKIVGLAALAAIAFFAFNSISNEYARIQSRVEVTQAKVDSLADELQATTETIHAAIRSLTDRFLANENGLADIEEPAKTQAEFDSGRKLEVRPTSRPTILMHSSPTCGPCVNWKNNELDRWTKAGWQVEVVDEEYCDRAKWPWYEITDLDGKQFEVIGPLNNNNFNAAKAGAK
jgi:hypothetical protein